MENELIVRLVECAKPLQSTTDVVGWEDTTSIPKKGEICLEYYTETSAGDIDYGKVCYKMKIGDGVNTYANLPYFPTTKDINAKIAAWVNAHLNATDYAQASIDTTTKTLTIQGIGETGGIIHQAESFALQFVEGNKIDITVQKSNNLSSTVTIAHEATTTTESTGTKREFGGSVVTGLTLDSMGHIVNIEKSALPDNPVDANTVTASNNLPENEIVLGNGTKTIKSSGKTITTTAPTSTSTDNTIPTSKAVDTAIDTKINALDSEVNADTNKVLTGVTQTNGELTAKADVSYTDIAPVQNVKSGNHITVSNSDNEYTVNHAAIGTGSAITPTTDGNTGWEGDVVTTVERDTYGHISGVKTKKIPSNPVSAGSTTSGELMKSDGDSTTSPSGFKASNSNINESGSTNSATLPTTSAIVTYVQNKMGDLAGALIYKGTVNSASDLPNNPTTGWMYVVATAGTYAGKVCGIGDYLIYNGSSWDVINSGNQVDDKNATLPWNTQTTIAEVNGTAIHVTLPENPVNSLDATNKGAASISGSTITIKAVSQNNGQIDDGDSTTINLDGTYDATNNKIATQTTVSDAIDTAVNNLDVDAYSQATVNTASVQGQTTLTIKGIKEVNGKIAADNTTNIKTDILIDGTYSNNNKLATQSTVDTAVTDAINNLDESKDIGAITFDTTKQSITVKAVQQEDGKIKDGGSTVIKLGDGLTATVDTGNNNVVSVDSDSIVAGDIKDPDIYSDNNDWTYRKTADGNTEAAGTDAAKLNPLKGNTIVWNQVVDNTTDTRTHNGVTYTKNVDGSYTITGSTTSTTSYCFVSSEFQQIANHKYLLKGGVLGKIRFGGYVNTGLNISDTPVIRLCTETANQRIAFVVTEGIDLGSGYTCYPVCIDLTKMFGSDDAIKAALGVSTLEGQDLVTAATNFEKLFPNSYYPYCEGRLVNLGGYGVKLNQLVQNGDFSEDTTGWTGITSVSSGIATKITTSTGSTTTGPIGQSKQYTINNKYLFIATVKSNNTATRIILAATGTTSEGATEYTYYADWTTIRYIWTAVENENPRLVIRGQNALDPNTDINFSVKNVMCIDLTEMFGPGSEPTLEEFEAMFPDDYYEYNTGTEMNIFDIATGDNKLGLVSTGFNQWDEEWENGHIGNTGTLADRENGIRSKNFSKCFGGAVYHVKANRGYAYAGLRWYDINKNFLGAVESSYLNNDYQAPANAAFFKVSVYNYTPEGTTATYNNDICINISDPSRNGTYEPYKKYTLDLDWIKTLKDSGGNLLFPYGLCSVGSVYDEVGEDYAIKRVGAVDLGSIDWARDAWSGVYAFYNYSFPHAKTGTNGVSPKYGLSNATAVVSLDDKKITLNYNTSNIYVRDDSYTSASDFKTSMSGVMLYYELATPITIHFNKKSMYYVVDDKGTEQLLPVNDADPVTAPIRGQVDYHSNIKEVVKDLIGTSSGDTYTLTSNNSSSSSTNDASITLTDSNGNKQSITVPFSAIRNDENITIILNGNF